MIVDISISKPFFEGEAVCHRSHTLRYITQGNGTLEINKKTIVPLSPGTIIFSPANTLLQSFSQDGMVDIVIYLTQFYIGQAEGEKLLVLHDDSTQTGYHTFSTLCNIFLQRNIFLDPLMKSIYQSLLQYIESMYIRSSCDPRIQKVTKHLEARFPSPDLSIESLLASQNQNADYIRRLFKKVHGYTPIQYLNQLRIGYAKKLIEGNCLHHRTITQIAEMSGFSDANYFSRVFRQQIGLSPSQYEKFFPGTILSGQILQKYFENRG